MYPRWGGGSRLYPIDNTGLAGQRIMTLKELLAEWNSGWWDLTKDIGTEGLVSGKVFESRRVSTSREGGLNPVYFFKGNIAPENP